MNALIAFFHRLLHRRQQQFDVAPVSWNRSMAMPIQALQAEWAVRGGVRYIS